MRVTFKNMPLWMGVSVGAINLLAGRVSTESWLAAFVIGVSSFAAGVGGCKLGVYVFGKLGFGRGQS